MSQCFEPLGDSGCIDFWRDAALPSLSGFCNWQPIVQRRASGAKVGIMGAGAIADL